MAPTPLTFIPILVVKILESGNEVVNSQRIHWRAREHSATWPHIEADICATRERIEQMVWLTGE
jgi:hypothetical protein